MNRQNYIYQLPGWITDKKAKKKKDGQLFWQLAVVIKNQNVSKINIFADSCEKKEIWQTIKASKYLGKEYIFYCKNFMGSYYLVDWKELKNHGSH